MVLEEITPTFGFAVAVTIYLLYERSRFNDKMVETMKSISDTLLAINNKLMEMDRFHDEMRRVPIVLKK